MTANFVRLVSEKSVRLGSCLKIVYFFYPGIDFKLFVKCVH